MQLVLGAALTTAMLLGAPLIARFEAAPQYTPYFRIAALIPFYLGLQRFDDLIAPLRW